jgi:hypothetical protein
MSGLEYILKTTFTIVLKQDEYLNQIIDAITNCNTARNDDDAKRCGLELGAAIHDILLWDFQH